MIQAITKNHLNQLRVLMQRLSDEQLAMPLQILKGSSVGNHVRHILEFYNCLFDALETGHLNYDLRKRDREMETSTEKCIRNLIEITRKLGTYPKDMPIKLHADYSITNESVKITADTTFNRELLYNVEHIVHHLAIIGIGIATLDPLLKMEENMGVAASTLRNNSRCAL